MIKGAIFDMDGLLFDTERVYRSCWETIASQFGVAHNPDFPPAIAGTSGESMRNCVKKFYPTVDCDAFIKAEFAMVKEETAKHIHKMEGVEEILTYFKEKGLKITVASGSPLKQVEQNLEKAGIAQYFDIITSSEEVTHGKPAPDVFLLAAERLGLKPEECYVLEDGINGMYAGIAAGCKSVMIPDLMEPTEEIKEKAYGIYPSLLVAMENL